jgi:hypothetical protein
LGKSFASVSAVRKSFSKNAMKKQVSRVFVEAMQKEKSLPSSYLTGNNCQRDGG